MRRYEFRMGQMFEKVDACLVKEVNDVVKLGKITAAEINFTAALSIYCAGSYDQAKADINTQIGLLDHKECKLTVNDLHPAIWSYCEAALQGQSLQ